MCTADVGAQHAAPQLARASAVTRNSILNLVFGFHQRTTNSKSLTAPPATHAPPPPSENAPHTTQSPGSNYPPHAPTPESHAPRADTAQTPSPLPHPSTQ